MDGIMDGIIDSLYGDGPDLDGDCSAVVSSLPTSLMF
jgi:hypothetical protein